jgi:hypothetical protein
LSRDLILLPYCVTNFEVVTGVIALFNPAHEGLNPRWSVTSGSGVWPRRKARRVGSGTQ